MVSHVSVEFRQQLIDTLKTQVSLTNFRGQREKAMRRHQKKKNHPRLPVSNIVGNSASAFLHSLKSQWKTNQAFYFITLVYINIQLVVCHGYLSLLYINSKHCWRLIVSVCISSSRFKHMSPCGQTEMRVSMHGFHAPGLAMQQNPAPCLAIWQVHHAVSQASLKALMLIQDPFRIQLWSRSTKSML